MISNIEHISSEKAIRNFKIFIIVMNIFIIVIFAVILYLDGLHPVTYIIVIFVGIIIMNVIPYIQFKQTTEYFDTLTFYFELDAKSFKEKTKQYLSVIEQIEKFLKKSNYNFNISFEGFKFGGFNLPYAKIYTFDSQNLKLKVRREKIGSSSSIARVIIGPVEESNEIKLRQIIEQIKNFIEMNVQK